MKTAVFIGRFQPLHRGHLDALREIGRRFGRLIIIIGSPTTERTRTAHNPLTTRERVALLRRALGNFPIPYVIKVQRDVGVNTLWRAEVLAKVPRGAVFVSGNRNVLAIFNARSVPVAKRYRISGTAIRRLVRRGDGSWARHVPASVRSARLGRRLRL